MAFNNSIALQKLLAEALDKKLVAKAKTSGMEANAAGIRYNGGNKFQFGKIGFGINAPSAYNRNTGYAESSVSLTYEEKTFKWDLGDSFLIDAMDNDESGFLDSAVNILEAYQDELVVPDVDKKRLAEIVTILKADQTLAATNVVTYPQSNFLKGLRDSFKISLTDTGLTETDLVCYMARSAYYDLTNDSAVQKVINLSGSPIELNFNHKSVDGVEIIVVDDSIMGNEKYIVCDRKAPIAIIKHNVTRIVTPEENQTADAWRVNVRIYHTLEIKDNELPTVVVAE